MERMEKGWEDWYDMEREMYRQKNEIEWEKKMRWGGIEMNGKGWVNRSR